MAKRSHRAVEGQVCGGGGAISIHAHDIYDPKKQPMTTTQPHYAFDYIALCSKHGITLTYFHAVKAGPSGVPMLRFQADGHSMALAAEHTPEELCGIVRDRLAEFDRRRK